MTTLTEYEVQGEYWGAWLVVSRYDSYQGAADLLGQLTSPAWSTGERRYRLVRRVSTVIVEG